MERKQGHDGSAFPLMRLPRKLRDHIYRLMVNPVLPYYELDGDPHGFFNRAILCTNRQVHTEASAAIAETAIAIFVDFWQLRYNKRYISLIDFTLLPFKRYSIDFDHTNQTTSPPGSLNFQIWDYKMRRQIHAIAKALSNVAHLEQLHINWFKPESESSHNDDRNVEQGHQPHPLPDEMMDCFFQLRGLQDVVITGNLADAYVGRLTRSLKRPKLAPQPEKVVVNEDLADQYPSRCIFGCSIKDSDEDIPDQHR